jgi:branched-subunit amino acid ABC-type transport system permease component
MAMKVNYGELLATAAGAVGAALYYDQVAKSQGQNAVVDAVVGTAVGAIFSLFTTQAGIVNNLSDGIWTGGLVWIALNRTGGASSG